MRRALLGLAGLGLPSPVLACAACVAAADRNRTFFVMTIVLSLLPLAMIGGGLWWVARQARGRLAAEFAEREPAAGSAAETPTFSAAGSSGEAPRPKMDESRSDPRVGAPDPAALRSGAISS